MLPRRHKLALLLAAAAILLLVGGRLAAEFVVELLWFRSVGYERAFWVRWGTGLAARAAFGLLIGALVFWNLWLVTRTLGAIRVRRRYANIEIAERLPQAYVVAALVVVSLFSAWWLSGAISEPVALLAAARAVPWGTEDPVFGRDLSFFVFRLPLLDGLQTLAGVLVFWIALLAGSAYVATGAVRFVGGRLSVAPFARQHLGMLAAAFLVVHAADAWLDRYQLVLEGSGIGSAFGYTDAHARLPGGALMAAAALLAAGGVAYAGRTGARREAVASLGLLVLVWLGTGLVYPAIVQKLVVEPNQFPRERPYIARHLEFARHGYGLAGMASAALPQDNDVVLSQERLLAAVSGAPLWDARPLLDAFEQQQTLFPYYTFVSAQADRYGPPEDAEQVAVAVREFDRTRLPAAAQTWQNLHLTYVGGQGAVATPVARMQEDGAPLYYLWDLDPPKVAEGAPAGLSLSGPAVYFGQRTDGYILVGGDAGPQGVRLGSAWRKLVFAWAFQSKNLLLSGELAERDRITYRRRVLDRVRALAPFLHVPQTVDPQPVISGGRIVWLVDAYTASVHYPLAPAGELGGFPVRYVRNSVKATVDALTGEVRLYRVDARDPMLSTFAGLFPGLFRPVEQMPADLQRHLRFPVALMALQARVLGDYHLTDPRAFYAKEDVWAVATETYRAEAVPVEPNYVILRLPGMERAEFLLAVPFVSRGRQNMTALFVARNDRPHYGEQTLFEFPRDQQVPGPQQVEAMIEQNPEIAQQLSLWRRGGSDVIRGHMSVVPLDGALVYVEPLFLVAETGAIPQLERVILARGRDVVMRPDLPAAVSALLGAEGARGLEEGPERVEVPVPVATAAPRGEQTLERVRSLFERAEAQLRAGDWAGFGRTWNALRDALRRSAPADAGPD